MDPVTASIIAAGIAAATTAASTATTTAINQFQSENDAFTAEIVNLSSCSFQIASGTSSPIRGQWMKPPSDIISIYDVIKDYPNADKDEIKAIIQATGNTGAGLSAFSISTMAKAGGLWGPAGLIQYDVIDINGAPTGDRLVFMMLIRPNWHYTAGVLMTMADVLRRNSEEKIYNYIESTPNSLFTNPSPGAKFNFNEGVIRKYFSTGTQTECYGPYNLAKVLANQKYGNSLKIEFQPGKITTFTIKDSYPVDFRIPEQS